VILTKLFSSIWPSLEFAVDRSWTVASSLVREEFFTSAFHFTEARPHVPLFEVLSGAGGQEKYIV
jgi:hypothetical protein